MKDTEKIFALSPVNGGAYDESHEQVWQWPKDTWLQNRLKKLRLKKTGLTEKLLTAMPHLS